MLSMFHRSILIFSVAWRLELVNILDHGKSVSHSISLQNDHEHGIMATFNLVIPIEMEKDCCH